MKLHAEQKSHLNKLYYGNNLDILRREISDESVDLVYLDPPFNPIRAASKFSQKKWEASSLTQIHGFDDTWTWNQEASQAYEEIIQESESARLVTALEGMLQILGESDLMAFLAMMTSRLIELRRVLRPSGSVFLHCDPVASQYLKLICDAIFGPQNFRNEIIWRKRIGNFMETGRLPVNHDVILTYAKTDLATWNEDAFFQPYDVDNLDKEVLNRFSRIDPDGRRYQLTDLTSPNPDRPNLTYEFLGVTKVWRWTQQRMLDAYEAGLIVQTAPGRVPRFKRYLDEQRGRPLGDVWSDIPPLTAQAAERLGYPTQKPMKLLERIIQIASSPDALVLDPFAGCGTTIDAAQKLGRRWIGIDITILAIELINARLRNTYSESIRETYRILGIPDNLSSANELLKRSSFEFARWCVTRVGGQPNDKPANDSGADGVIRIPIDAEANSQRVLVSVETGTASVTHVRNLLGIIELQGAAMGLLVCTTPPSAAMYDAANSSGTYIYPPTGESYPKIHLITVAEILKGTHPNIPTPLIPYFQTKPRYEDSHESAWSD